MPGGAARDAPVVDRSKPACRAEQAILRSSKHHFRLCLTFENVSRRFSPLVSFRMDERFSFRNPLYGCALRAGGIHRRRERSDSGECRYPAAPRRGVGGANRIACHLAPGSTDGSEPGTLDRCEPHRRYQVVRRRLCRLPRSRRSGMVFASPGCLIRLFLRSMDRLPAAPEKAWRALRNTATISPVQPKPRRYFRR